jgi:hypothetical protein
MSDVQGATPGRLRSLDDLVDGWILPIVEVTRKYRQIRRWFFRARFVIPYSFVVFSRQAAGATS